MRPQLFLALAALAISLVAAPRTAASEPPPRPAVDVQQQDQERRTRRPSPRSVTGWDVDRVLVTLNCEALEGNRVGDCRVVEEDPPGTGFGAVAVRRVERARPRRNHRPPEERPAVGSRVNITLRFTPG